MPTMSASSHHASDVPPGLPRFRSGLCLLVAAGCGLQTPLDEPGTNGGGPMGVGNASTAWPAEVRIDTCDPFRDVTVGSYVVETNFWNQGACPGTQCMAINSATGDFTVTQFPSCGDTVASYPNLLYGCAWGTCSQNSTLPMMVSKLTSVTSSWAFSVGGSESDQYDVAYDIWFCPDDTCSGGFAGGTELMIWLDYRNLSGWQNRVGSMTLAGHAWDLWVATQGGAGMGWTYLAYLIHAPMQTAVTDFDLMAFVRDALSRGYLQASWYLYAVQAGDELRTGGLPYNNLGFSVTVR
jgi:hypothetical protein